MKGLMDDLLDQRIAANPQAAKERVGGRLMIAAPDQQLYWFVEDEALGRAEELPSVGERIVELADGTRTVREIATALTREFEVDLATALSDTAEFVRQLVESGVLVATGRQPPREAS
jgi:hypothetical protein